MQEEVYLEKEDAGEKGGDIGSVIKLGLVAQAGKKGGGKERV